MQTFKIEPFKHPIAMDPNYAGIIRYSDDVCSMNDIQPWSGTSLCFALYYAALVSTYREYQQILLALRERQTSERC